MLLLDARYPVFLQTRHPRPVLENRERSRGSNFFPLGQVRRTLEEISPDPVEMTVLNTKRLGGQEHHRK